MADRHLFTAENRPEAEMVVHALLQEGVGASYRSIGGGSIPGPPYRIDVDEEDYEEALIVLDLLPVNEKEREPSLAGWNLNSKGEFASTPFSHDRGSPCAADIVGVQINRRSIRWTRNVRQIPTPGR
jgi:hypothetical protein